MSGEIDNNVVSMRFDNSQFQRGVSQTLDSLSRLKEGLKFKNSTKGLSDVSNSIKNITLDHISNGIDTISNKFTTLGIMGVTALQNITNQAINTGQRMVSALTIDPVKLGFQEYETQINAVQTILANTESKGSTLEDVNNALDELNKYADMTIYNFTEMTRNIGTFTAAGVDLETSTAAIKGIANLAAVSGSTSMQASTAMYQLSQALASGTVKLQDWNSVVNAGMGGQVFQDALKETARVHGIAIDDMITKEGSFRETLSNGWLSSQILTETLAKFTGDLSEEELRAIGYTEDQIQSIVKMGETANDAATKVKTFTQLFDTLQEAAQSGWTQTWEIFIGDFEEAKELLTSISDTVSDFINKSAEARNTLLQGWKDSGGRTMLIDSLSHGFELILQLVTPVKEAMNNIFPPMTVDKLVNITKAVTDFINNLTVSEGTIEKVRNIFEGFFGVLRIGQLVLFDVAKRFAGLYDVIKPYLSIFFTFISDIGSKIGNFAKLMNDNLEQGISPLRTLKDAFVSLVDKAVNKLDDLGLNVRKVLDKIKETFQGFTDTSSGLFSDLFNRLSTRVEPIKNVFMNVWNYIHDLIEKLAQSGPSFEEIAAAFDKAFQAIRDVISNALSGANFDQGLDLINTGMLGGLLVLVHKFVNGTKEVADAGEGIFDKIKNVLDGLRGSLESFQNTLNGAALLMIASAVGILAASLIGLSLVDSEKLTTALMAITILFGDLFAMLSGFTRISETKGLASASIGLIGLSVAILILSKAMKSISELDGDQIAKGLVAVGVAMAELAGFMTLVDESKFNVSSGVGLIALATAMVILSSAIEKMGSLDIDTLYKGLGSLAAALIAMSYSMDLLDGMENSVSIGLGMILIATSLVILSSAVEKFGSIDPESLGRGLLSMSVSLLALTAAMNAMSEVENAISIGIGIIGVATAMLILSQAVEKFSSIDPDSLSRGLFAMSVSLLAITAAVNSMPKNLPSIAAGLLILVVSLEVLAHVMSVLGNFDSSQLAKSLIALGGAMMIVAVGLNLMRGTLAGSAALLFAAVALGMIAPVLMLLGSMSIESIILAIASLAGAIGVLAGIAVLLEPVLPVMFALAITLGTFGAACLAVGVGVALLSASLLLLSGSGIAVGTAITGIIAALAGSIPLIITKIGEGLVALITYVGSMASEIANAIGQLASSIINVLISLIPQVGQLISALISEILRILVEAIPEVGQVISTLITEILRILTEAIPKMVDAGLRIVQGVLEGIGNNIEGIVNAGADLLVNFLNGIQNNIGRVVDEGIQTAISFINGIADGIRNNKDDIWDAMENLLTAIAEFFLSGGEKLLEIGGDILDGIGQGIQDAIGHIGDFLVDLPAKIAEALNPANLIEAGSNFFAGLFGGDTGEEDAYTVGENITSSTSSGIDDNASMVSDSATSAVSDANTSASETASGFSSVGLNIASGTASGIDNNTYLVENAAARMMQAAKLAAEQEGDINSPSRVFMNQIGKYIAMGTAVGINKFNYMVSQASSDMVKGAFDEADKSLSDFSNILSNTDIENINPTIKPVVDLTNVVEGSNQIDSLLNKGYKYSMGQNASNDSIISALGNTIDMTQSIASGMSFNTDNDDVVDAINNLSSKLGNIPSGSTYNFNGGITYDDGSGLNQAVSELVDAVVVGRRM